uniref:Uncharacterized protein n=1 Tax=Acrobeloides nanus TaxID=290746 RepID=A0A914CJ22_9BILA
MKKEDPEQVFYEFSSYFLLKDNIEPISIEGSNFFKTLPSEHNASNINTNLFVGIISKPDEIDRRNAIRLKVPNLLINTSIIFLLGEVEVTQYSPFSPIKYKKSTCDSQVDREATRPIWQVKQRWVRGSIPLG